MMFRRSGAGNRNQFRPNGNGRDQNVQAGCCSRPGRICFQGEILHIAAKF